MEGAAQELPVERAERRYRALLEHMSEGFVVAEAIFDAAGAVRDYWIREANPVYLKRAPPEIAAVGRRQLELRPGTPAYWFETCGAALAGQAVRFEFRDPINGHWYEVHMMRLSDTEFGQLFVDVTHRKHAEQRQADLFGELNHRVKNNLSVVSAILALQARTSSQEVREALECARDRVAAIADLHTALCRQESAHDVELCSYIADLVERLGMALGADGGLQITSRCDKVSLPVADAVSVGLIVNELVTNAAKHAFGPGRQGRIEIELRRRNGGIALTVSDDGCGLATGALSKRGGLGSRIVQSLADDLGGEVRRLSGPGTAIRIEFPAPAQARDPVR